MKRLSKEDKGPNESGLFPISGQTEISGSSGKSSNACGRTIRKIRAKREKIVPFPPSSDSPYQALSGKMMTEESSQSPTQEDEKRDTNSVLS